MGHASVNGQGGWTEKRSEAVHPRCFHQRRDAVSKGGMVAVLVGESINFSGGLAWLRDNGVAVYDLHDAACITLLAEYIAAYPDIWHEDIGEA